jgi:hypothetical protein
MKITFNRKGSYYKGDINHPTYTKSFVGNALKVLFTRGVSLPSDVDPKNLVARGQNFNYQENYQILPVLEWDTYFIQELLLGMQEMGSFDCQAMYTLRLNDSLPTVKTLAWETELTLIQSAGQDTPTPGMVLNSWYGARFAGRGSTMSPNGIVMESLRGMYRYRLTGKDWKLMNPMAFYPGDVSEVDMVSSAGTP